MKFKGLRIITNLDCNYRCNFCYQKDKSCKRLSLHTLSQTVNPYKETKFEYCTIMGGESTLLPNLAPFITIGASVSKQTRLTTNGSRLNGTDIAKWKACGLSGINISMPVLGPEYVTVTGSGVSSCHVQNNVMMVANYYGADQTRVNIPLCEANMEDPSKLKEMLWLFAHVMKVKITLCDDILESYSLRQNPEKYDLTFIKDTGYGLLIYDFHGREIGCYAHKDNYKETDLIVSPVGIFPCWDGYCNAIGLNYHKPKRTFEDIINKARGINMPPKIPITFD